MENSTKYFWFRWSDCSESVHIADTTDAALADLKARKLKPSFPVTLAYHENLDPVKNGMVVTKLDNVTIYIIATSTKNLTARLLSRREFILTNVSLVVMIDVGGKKFLKVARDYKSLYDDLPKNLHKHVMPIVADIGESFITKGAYDTWVKYSQVSHTLV